MEDSMSWPPRSNDHFGMWKHLLNNICRGLESCNPGSRTILIFTDNLWHLLRTALGSRRQSLHWGELTYFNHLIMGVVLRQFCTSEYYHTNFFANYPKKCSCVSTDNFYLEFLDCGTKIISGPLQIWAQIWCWMVSLLNHVVCWGYFWSKLMAFCPDVR